MARLTPPPRIVRLRVRNYRALKDVELKKLSPFSVFVGPNGSGKSTIFDVFAFLSECFTHGLRRAWDARGRFRQLRTRGSDEPIHIELQYKEHAKPLITYALEIDEDGSGPYVNHELLRWKRGSHGRPFNFLEFRNGMGEAVSGEQPDINDVRNNESLAARDMLAVNTLGQFEKHPRVAALRNFIIGWHLSYLSASDPRGVPEAGPQEHLSETGDNLANVVQYLSETHPELLTNLLQRLSARVPRLESVSPKTLEDGRLLLQFKDAPFEDPILAKYVSDGTIKMLAYMALMNDPAPASLIGIEEPENYLYPRLLYELAEECRNATTNTQLLVTTHSPEFLNALTPGETWVLQRNEQGYTTVSHLQDDSTTLVHYQEGGRLGDLWMEGYFGRVKVEGRRASA